MMPNPALEQTLSGVDPGFAFNAYPRQKASLSLHPLSAESWKFRSNPQPQENMTPEITKSMQMDWTPLVEAGAKTDGIQVKVLRFDKATGRPPTFLLKFDAGASYPNHTHPGGEEVFVLEGEVRFGPNQLEAGDYLYTPPGAQHPVFSKTGCVMFFIVPEEVQLTGQPR